MTRDGGTTRPDDLAGPGLPAAAPFSADGDDPAAADRGGRGVSGQCGRRPPSLRRRRPAFRCLLNSIREAGGSAQVLRAEAIEGERDLAAAFNAAREREYDQIIAGCGDIAAGIQEHTAAGHFRVAVSNR